VFISQRYYVPIYTTSNWDIDYLCRLIQWITDTNFASTILSKMEFENAIVC